MKSPYHTYTLANFRASVAISNKIKKFGHCHYTCSYMFTIQTSLPAKQFISMPSLISFDNNLISPRIAAFNNFMDSSCNNNTHMRQRLLL